MGRDAPQSKLRAAAEVSDPPGDIGWDIGVDIWRAWGHGPGRRDEIRYGATTGASSKTDSKMSCVATEGDSMLILSGDLPLMLGVLDRPALRPIA